MLPTQYAVIIPLLLCTYIFTSQREAQQQQGAAEPVTYDSVLAGAGAVQHLLRVGVLLGDSI